jgi:hypothetical protein
MKDFRDILESGPVWLVDPKRSPQDVFDDTAILSKGRNRAKACISRRNKCIDGLVKTWMKYIASNHKWTYLVQFVRPFAHSRRWPPSGIPMKRNNERIFDTILMLKLAEVLNPLTRGLNLIKRYQLNEREKVQVLTIPWRRVSEL